MSLAAQDLARSLLDRARSAPTAEARLHYLHLYRRICQQNPSLPGEETDAAASAPSGPDRRVVEARALSVRRAGLQASLRACRRCALASSRTQVVVGVGPMPATLAVVGEAPGHHEDRQGQPFVGKAGKLLDAVLAEVGIPRSSLYITNAVLCRPPENREPEESELAACSTNLQAQLSLCGARAVLALGATAMAALGVPGSVHRRRATWTWTGDRAVYVTYHPAAALRDEEKRALLRDDLRTLKPTLERLERVQRDGLGRRYSLLSPYDPRPDLAADSAEWSTLLACATVFSPDAHPLLHYLRCEGAGAYRAPDGIRVVVRSVESPVADVERELRRHASVLRDVPALSRRQVREWEGPMGGVLGFVPDSGDDGGDGEGA